MQGQQGTRTLKDLLCVCVFEASRAASTAAWIAAIITSCGKEWNILTQLRYIFIIQMSNVLTSSLIKIVMQLFIYI